MHNFFGEDMSYFENHLTREVLDRIEEYLYSTASDKTRSWLRTNYKVDSDNLAVLGAKKITLDNIAKAILIEGRAEEYLRLNYATSVELVLIAGMVIALDRVDAETLIQRLVLYLNYANSWVTIDPVAHAIKVVDDTKYYDFLISLVEDKGYRCRFKIVGLIEYMKTYGIEKILPRILMAKDDSYTVHMAIAWAITEAFSLDVDKTLLIYNPREISSVINKMTLCKVKDARKISHNDKIRIIKYIQNN